MSEAISFEEFKQQNAMKEGEKKVWSRSKFIDYLVVFLNDEEFKSHKMIVKNKDEVEQVWYRPVKKGKKVLINMLRAAGLTEADAKAFAKSHKLKKKDVSELFDVFSDFLYEYLSTGRKVRLIDKEDMTAVLEASDDKRVGKIKYPKSKNYVNYKPRKKVKVTNPCAKWNKEEMDEEGTKVVRTMTIKRVEEPDEE